MDGVTGKCRNLEKLMTGLDCTYSTAHIGIETSARDPVMTDLLNNCRLRYGGPDRRDGSSWGGRTLASSQVGTCYMYALVMLILSTRTPFLPPAAAAAAAPERLARRRWLTSLTSLSLTSLNLFAMLVVHTVHTVSDTER